MWQIRKTDLQIYLAVNVELNFVQHQPTIFSPTYEMYVSQIEQINKEISNLDKEIEKEPWEDSLKGKNLMAIREQKTKDRQQLLNIFGTQVLELKRLEK